MPSPTCENCDEEEASKHCAQCDQDLCTSCEAELHKPAKMQSHTRTPVGAGEAPSAAGGPAAREATAPAAVPAAAAVAAPAAGSPPPTCENCDDAPSVERCADCDQPLCADCSRDLHAPAKMQSHRRTRHDGSEPPRTGTPTAAALPQTPPASPQPMSPAPARVSPASPRPALDASRPFLNRMSSDSSALSPRPASPQLDRSLSVAPSPPGRQSLSISVPSPSARFGVPAPIPERLASPTAVPCSKCSGGDAVADCTECGMQLCSACNLEIHRAPANRFHKRTRIGSESVYSDTGSRPASPAPSMGSVPGSPRPGGESPRPGFQQQQQQQQPPGPQSPVLGRQSSMTPMRPGSALPGGGRTSGPPGSPGAGQRMSVIAGGSSTPVAAAAAASPSPSVSAAGSAAGGNGGAPAKTCGLCEEASATLWCPDCRMHLCEANGCAADIHKPAKAQSHRPVPYPPVADAASSARPPSVPPSPAQASTAVPPSSTAATPVGAAQMRPAGTPAPSPAAASAAAAPAAASGSEMAGPGAGSSPAHHQRFASAAAASPSPGAWGRQPGALGLAGRGATPVSSSPNGNVSPRSHARSPSAPQAQLAAIAAAVGPGTSAGANPRRPPSLFLDVDATNGDATGGQKRLCSCCEDEDAEVRCQECPGHDFCVGCDMETHLPAKFSGHHRVPIVARPAQVAVVSSSPSGATAAAAVVARGGGAAVAPSAPLAAAPAQSVPAPTAANTAGVPSAAAGPLTPGAPGPTPTAAPTAVVAAAAAAAPAAAAAAVSSEVMDILRSLAAMQAKTQETVDGLLKNAAPREAAPSHQSSSGHPNPKSESSQRGAVTDQPRYMRPRSASVCASPSLSDVGTASPVGSPRVRNVSRQLVLATRAAGASSGGPKKDDESVADSASDTQNGAMSDSAERLGRLEKELEQERKARELITVRLRELELERAEMRAARPVWQAAAPAADRDHDQGARGLVSSAAVPPTPGGGGALSPTSDPLSVERLVGLIEGTINAALDAREGRHGKVKAAWASRGEATAPATKEAAAASGRSGKGKPAARGERALRAGKGERQTGRGRKSPVSRESSPEPSLMWSQGTSSLASDPVQEEDDAEDVDEDEDDDDGGRGRRRQKQQQDEARALKEARKIAHLRQLMWRTTRKALERGTSEAGDLAESPYGLDPWSPRAPVVVGTESARRQQGKLGPRQTEGGGQRSRPAARRAAGSNSSPTTWSIYRSLLQGEDVGAKGGGPREPRRRCPGRSGRADAAGPGGSRGERRAGAGAGVASERHDILVVVSGGGSGGGASGRRMSPRLPRLAPGEPSPSLAAAPVPVSGRREGHRPSEPLYPETRSRKLFDDARGGGDNDVLSPLSPHFEDALGNPRRVFAFVAPAPPPHPATGHALSSARYGRDVVVPSSGRSRARGRDAYGSALSAGFSDEDEPVS